MAEPEQPGGLASTLQAQAAAVPVADEANGPPAAAAPVAPVATPAADAAADNGAVHATRVLLQDPSWMAALQEPADLVSGAWGEHASDLHPLSAFSFIP